MINRFFNNSQRDVGEWRLKTGGRSPNNSVNCTVEAKGVASGHDYWVVNGGLLINEHVCYVMM